jgi:hypothetical protein
MNSWLGLSLDYFTSDGCLRKEWTDEYDEDDDNNESKEREIERAKSGGEAEAGRTKD